MSTVTETISSGTPVRARYYTTAQVRAHDTPEDLWMIIFNKVYDVTTFAKDHPGGVEVVFDCGGVDCTEAFEDVAHSDDAMDMLAPYYVGDLVPEEHKTYGHLRVPRALVEDTASQSTAVSTTVPPSSSSRKASVSSKKHNKRKKKLVETLTMVSLAFLALLAFIICVVLQKLKWSDLLKSKIGTST